jgi:hypothetical protein
VKLGALDNSQIGQGFAGIGYGQSDNNDRGETRRVGALSLRALEGRTYELLLGSLYARFTPEVLTFLEQAVLWQDPCQSLPARGECAGEHARRCSTLAEGKRRVVEVDCSTLGLRCVPSKRDGASCQ